MNGKPAPARRFHGLDAIRGVAAILVAFRHVPLLAAVDFPESFLAVDLFFVLSGVVLCDAYGLQLREGLSWRAFLGLRILRLYPLYLLGSMVGLLAFVTGPTPLSPLPAAELAALAIAMIPVAGSRLYPLDGPAWSLLLELAANATYGILAKVVTPLVLAAIIAAFGCELVALSVAQPHHSLDLGWTSDSLLGGMVRVGFSFAVGIALRHRLDQTSAVPWRSATHVMVVCAILLAILAILTARPSVTARPFLELGAILVGFPALVCLMLRCQLNGLALRISVGLGAMSYPLYILHAPLGQLASHAGFGRQAFTPLNGLIVMVVLVGISAWLDQAYDRPVRARLTALFKRNTAWTGRLAPIIGTSASPRSATCGLEASPPAT